MCRRNLFAKMASGALVRSGGRSEGHQGWTEKEVEQWPRWKRRCHMGGVASRCYTNSDAGGSDGFSETMIVVIQLYGSMVIQKSDISSFHSDSCPKKLVLLSTWLALTEGKEKMKKWGLTEKDLEQYYMEDREKTQERMEKAVMNIQVMGETKTMDEVKKRVEDWESGPKVVEVKGKLYVEASMLGNQAESSSRSKEEVVDVDEVKEVKEVKEAVKEASKKFREELEVSNNLF